MSVHILGSTVRDDATPDSDIDLVTDYDRARGFPLIGLVGIKQMLEDRLGMSVDITTRDSLEPILRDQIEMSAERIL